MATPTSLNSLLTVSSNNVDIRSASGPQVTFSTQYPFGKLDKTNNVSFQNISILFKNEPPNPAGTPGNTGPIKTLVYSFAHGYKYVPSTWFLMQNPSNVGVGLEPAYQQEGGIIIATDEANFTGAIMQILVDQTNVNLYVWKYYDSTNSPALPNIQGFSLNIRIYVFAGDLTGTPAGS
jgi:hypothetical protein